jgi:murein L,D-transpeptidase YcbB/YkuD
MDRLYRHKRPALAILAAGVALGAAVAWLSIDTRPPPRQPVPLAGSLAAADLAIARALRNTMPATIGSMVAGSSRTAVERFYMARGFAPLWVERGVLNARGRAALSYLQTVARVGFDPADYIDPAANFAGGPESIARSELQFTVLLLKYVRDAMHGRVAPTRLSADIHYARSAPDPVAILDGVASAQDIAGHLDSFHPTHRGFIALATKLAELKEPDAVGGSPTHRDILIANLERWRWLPRDLGTSYVIVNVADFRLRLIDRGTLRFAARVVVGEPATATPVFSANMTSITINPVWNIPDSIARKEYLPRLQQDPGLLHRIGLKMERRSDGSVLLSQQPGAANALGRIRFNLPNRFQIYQHDTPEVELFDRRRRAYSHGCVRVENPIYYAQALLAIGRPDETFPPEKLWSMIGEAEIHLPFSVPVPVHTTYQTAFVDDEGRLVMRDDVYRHDTAMLAAFAIDAKRRDRAREHRAAATTSSAGGKPNPSGSIERKLQAARELFFQRESRGARQSFGWEFKRLLESARMLRNGHNALPQFH